MIYQVFGEFVFVMVFFFPSYSSFSLTYDSMQTDYMEREPPKIVTLMLNAFVFLALVPFICNSQANSEQLDKPVSREIANKENPGTNIY